VPTVSNDRPGVIYGIRARAGDQIRYVGQTVLLPKRRRTHLRLARNGSAYDVHLWIARLGGAVEFVVLEECIGADSLNEAEIRWIAELKKDGLPLLNGTDGGVGGNPHRRPDYSSPEWRQAYESGMADRNTYRPDAAHVARTLGAYRESWTDQQKAEHYAGVSAKLTGIKRSPETRARMSEAQKISRAKRRGDVVT